MDTKLFSPPRPRAEPRTLTLTPDQSFPEAGRAVLRFYFDQLLRSEADSLNHDSPAALHDLRVAARRLRAALRDFRPAFDRARVRQLEKDTAWLGTLVGRIRDLDVFLDWLGCYAAEAPESQRPAVRRVIREREAMRARQRAAFLAGLQSPRYAAFCAGFRQLLDESGDGRDGGVPKKAGALQKKARARIARGFRRVCRRARGANDRHPLRLHRLRLETKRLRYTAQFFRSLDPDRLKQWVDRAGKVQDALGDFHDAQMQIQFLKEMRRLESADAEMRTALQAMIDRRKSEQAGYYRDFQKAYRKLKKIKDATGSH